MGMSRALSVEVSFDLVCPWCLIGKRHLDTALAMLRAQRPDVAVEIAWRSCPLLPRIPPQGVPFTDFYRQRLGSAGAVARRQAQVREAARAAGTEVARATVRWRVSPAESAKPPAAPADHTMVARP